MKIIHNDPKPNTNSRIFKVIKRETSTQYALVEARDRDEAINKASEHHRKNPIHWRENQDYKYEIVDARLATTEDIKGKIVDI